MGRDFQIEMGQFRPGPKEANFAKFRRNFAEIFFPEDGFIQEYFWMTLRTR
jgi:hypothetical protein